MNFTGATEPRDVRVDIANLADRLPSKRELFAALLFSRAVCEVEDDVAAVRAAKRAVRYADVLLTELAKPR